MGGFMNDHIGYRYTNDIMMVLCFSIFLVYLFFNYIFCQKKSEIRKTKDESPVGFDELSLLFLDYADAEKIENNTIDPTLEDEE